MQRADFVELFEIMAGCPGHHPFARSRRLHEFLPHDDQPRSEEVAERLGY